MGCCLGEDHQVLGQVWRQQLRLGLPHLVFLVGQLALPGLAGLGSRQFALAQVPQHRVQHRPQRAQLTSLLLPFLLARAPLLQLLLILEICRVTGESRELRQLKRQT